MFRFFLIGWFPACAVLAGCAGQSRQETTHSQDTGVSPGERDEAAKAACKLIWDHEPMAQRYEYCGTLYLDGAAIGIGRPETNRKATGCWPSDPPEGTILLGRYHSHRVNAEPSNEDRTLAARYPTLGHYLCAPSGVVRRFSQEEGTVIVK
jgi:hypothetical protein